MPAILALLALAPAVARAQAGADSVILVWTAPGDDGSIGTATRYELRLSQQNITDQAAWDAASEIPNLPSPQGSGTRESFVVHGLTQGTVYYFALRTSDDVGNQSPLSNVLRWDWVYDTAAPAAPLGLGAAREGDGVRVRWGANSEADLIGYTIYRWLDGAGVFEVIAGPLAGTQYLDSSIPPGTESAEYQVTALDDSGNESARSSSVSVSFVSVTTAWTLDPPYPNPSKIYTPVSIPVVVPSAGGGGAELRILDAGGHQVRRIQLGSYAAGAQTVAWDGRNEAGRLLAPGVYTAWLIAGAERNNTKVVRVP
jgi:flagellar hook capping protein FlgD/fibronectin type III domain protein